MKTIRQWFKNWKLRWQVWRCEREAARRVAAVKRAYPGCEGAMNAWPPVAGTTTGYDAEGVTTILWGTDEFLQSPRPLAGGFFFVTRIDQRQLVDNIKLPNGSGPTVTRVLITDGDQWNVTVRDDTRMTPPLVGDAVSIIDGAGHKGTRGLVYSAIVVDANWESAMKQAGERVIVCENLTLVDSQTSAAQA